jgi:4-amino-4-deoxy-L-arabinose transferase-like glycosyltransferase
MKGTNKFLLPIIILLCFFQLYTGISGKDLQEWDESRNGVNAYEMIQNGDYINLYYGNEPDTWNAKPPLMVWMIVAGYKLLGYVEWALRLPAALSILLIFIVLFQFIKRYESPLFAFMVCLVLLGCKGLIGFHSGINGDFDALLSLFLLLSAICYFKYEKLGKPLAIYGVAVFTGLAFYTKGTAAFLFLPGFALYSIISGSIKRVLTNKHTWYALLLLCGMVTSWIVIALLNAPHYAHSTYGSNNSIETMLVHDTFRRLTSNDFDSKNIRDYLFFIKAADVRFNIWNYFFYLSSAVGLWLIYQHRSNLRLFINRANNQLTLWALCISLPVVIALNFAVNMHDWYFTPLWCFMAIILVRGLNYLIWRQKVFAFLLAGIFIFTVTRHFLYLYKLPHELHKVFVSERQIFKGEEYILLSENPKQNLLLYLNWMNMGFQKVTDHNTATRYKGKIFVITRNNFDISKLSVQTLRQTDEYLVVRIL